MHLPVHLPALVIGAERFTRIAVHCGRGARPPAIVCQPAGLNGMPIEISGASHLRASRVRGDVRHEFLSPHSGLCTAGCVFPWARRSVDLTGDAWIVTDIPLSPARNVSGVGNGRLVVKGEGEMECHASLPSSGQRGSA